MQIDSLNQIIYTYEQQIFQKLGPNSDYEQVCEKWRQKVFQTIFDKKRIEVIAQNNLSKYNKSH